MQKGFIEMEKGFTRNAECIHLKCRMDSLEVQKGFTYMENGFTWNAKWIHLKPKMDSLEMK